MSARFDFRSAGPLRSTNLTTIAPTRVEQASALDLPGEQKFALVYLRKTKDGADSLAAKIVPHLNETGVPFPTGAHWTELRREGHVTFETGGHRLTPKGDGAALTIMRDLARKFSIHHVTFRAKGARTNMGPTASCSCGQWHRVVGRSRSDENRLQRAAAEHLDQVKRGTFVKPRSIEEFLNEYMPLQASSRTKDLMMISDDRRADDIGTPDAELARRLIEANDTAVPAPFNERLVGAALRTPIADEDRVGLRRLIEAGKMARQKGGGWGLSPLSKRLLTVTVGNRLKARDLAIPGFDKVTLYPSNKGKRIIAQEDADGAATP